MDRRQKLAVVLISGLLGMTLVIALMALNMTLRNYNDVTHLQAQNILLKYEIGELQKKVTK